MLDSCFDSSEQDLLWRNYHQQANQDLLTQWTNDNRDMSVGKFVISQEVVSFTFCVSSVLKSLMMKASPGWQCSNTFPDSTFIARCNKCWSLESCSSVFVPIFIMRINIKSLRLPSLHPYLQNILKNLTNKYSFFPFRLRSLLRMLQHGEISAEVLQKNLHYAARVLEAVFLDETK